MYGLAQPLGQPVMRTTSDSVARNPTFSNMLRIRLRISGAPRSASAMASGHSGNAGHAIAVTFNGSTNLGDCEGKDQFRTPHDEEDRNLV